MKSIHFISGLPRSGSTLLAAILNQNPDFRAGMTSPLYSIFAGALANMSARNEASVFLTEQQRMGILNATTHAFFDCANVELDTTVFDTSRAWTTKTGILFELFPEARMICCVRNLAWIVDSFERIIQQNKYQLSGMFKYSPHMNVYQRANQLTGPEGIIGSSYNNLREAFFGPHSDKLMLIDYETLCRTPQFVMQSIYGFCGFPYNLNADEDKKWYRHDFDNVQYSADEFDERLGTPGLHTVRRKVEPFQIRLPLIPPDIFAAHHEQDFWNQDQARSKSNAVVL